MSGADADPQLVLFQRQYLQLFEPDFLAWPPLPLLRNADAQVWLDRYLFDAARVPHRPPPAYQIRVLRTLVDRVRRAAPADTTSGCLARRLDALVAAHLPPPEDDAAAAAAEPAPPPEDAHVTFTCLQAPRDGGGPGRHASTITLLERRRLVSGSRVTGFRTWEGALHLGAYLLSDAGRRLVRGRNVLELGAGTGFVAILCAKLLAAKHVTTTDGDVAVVDALAANVALNGLDGHAVKRDVLWWGSDLRGTWVDEDCATSPYDVVVGADITYHADAVVALATTLRQLFDMRPQLLVVIASVVRNASTFQLFRTECLNSGFSIEEVPFPMRPVREQQALFYAAAVPVKILHIRRGQGDRGCSHP